MNITIMQLLIIDLLYSVQFILFMIWYFPRTIIFSGYTNDNTLMFFASLFMLSEMIIFYLLLSFTVVKGFKE